VLNPLFWLQAISLAFSQIWANKSRAFLTALGIIVGVASTTAVIAALTGLRARVLTEFESVGASKFFVFPDRPDNAPRNLYPFEKIRVTTEEARAIREECTLVKAITPVTEVGLDVQQGDKIIDGITVAGIWPDWHVVQNRFVEEGRPFTQIDEDGERQVCLINADAITELNLPANPVGESILIGGRRFAIVGVVETTQARFFGMNTSSAEIFIPFSVAAKMQERRGALHKPRGRGGWTGGGPLRHAAHARDPSRRRRDVQRDRDRPLHRAVQGVGDRHHRDRRGHRRHLASGRRHRDHEHHAGIGVGTHA
jgi:putative ABC transport system permease protein